MDKTKFGNFIKELRLQKQYTQKELADLLFLDVTAISKWERGVSYPDITLIPAICKIFGVSEHELIESSKDSEYRRIKKESETYSKIKNSIFYTFSACYLVAIITCFIVNLAVDHTLSWFFVVFASCLTGFTFCPTVLRWVNSNKLLFFVISTLASLFLLFLTCSIYSHSYWALVASSGTLLGYFVLFFPVLFNIHVRDKRDYLRKFFFIFYSIGMMSLTFILFCTIDIVYSFNINNAFLITAYCFSIMIIIGLELLINARKKVHAAIHSFVLGFYLFGLNGVLNSVLDGKGNYYAINFLDWSNYSDGNASLLILIIFILLGLFFIITGINKKTKTV